jgi:chromate transporter
MKPSLRALTGVFFRIVNLTFGGGEPTMAALQREMVERRHWIDNKDYGLIYGLARLTPGTNLIAFCAGAAWMVRGWPGTLLVTCVATAPSALVVVWLTWGYSSIRASHVAQGAILGAIAAAVGMMFAAAWNLTRPAVRKGDWLRAAVFAAAAAGLSLGLSVAPIQVLAAAALAGAMWRGQGREA